MGAVYAKTYRNRAWGFEIDVPFRFVGPGTLSRLLRLDRQPVFRDRDGSLGIQMAIGPYRGPTSLEERQEVLRAIASRHRHRVLAIGAIAVLGKDHPTVTYQLPVPSFGPFVCPEVEAETVIRSLPVLKNWHLLFQGIEYVFTVHQGDHSQLLDPDTVAATATKADDIIVQSFRFFTTPIASQKALEETNRRIDALLAEP